MRGWALLSVSLALLVAAELVTGIVVDTAPRPVDHLQTLPAERGVWLVGNSMMETATDREVLADGLGVRVDLEDHGAHYSSLWYLILRNALPDLEHKPAVVVWGYRPHTAAIPELRINVRNDTELFFDPGDREYLDLIGAAGDEEWLAERIADEVGDQVRDRSLWRARGAAQEALDDMSLELAARALDVVGADAMVALLRDEVMTHDRSLADIATRLTTHGAVEFANARVDDLAGDWVRGEPRPFADTFLPLIAQLLIDAGIPQVVVVHPQRDASTGAVVAAESHFVDDANAWFAERAIPVVDGFHDSSFEEVDFGGGDHLGVGGRAKLNSTLLDTLRVLLGS